MPIKGSDIINKCPLCQKEKFSYITHWQKWRENRISDWKKDKDRKKLAAPEIKNRIKEYLSGGYAGETCHDCNTKCHKRETELLDKTLSDMENMMQRPYNNNNNY